MSGQNGLEVFGFLGLFCFFEMLWAGLGAAIGSAKGRTGTGALYGILLGPLGLLIIWLERGDRVECGGCDKLISPKARRCPYCRTGQPIMATAVHQPGDSQALLLIACVAGVALAIAGIGVTIGAAVVMTSPAVNAPRR